MPDMSREYHTADTNMSRRFLKHLNDNVLLLVLRELTRNKVL